MELLLVLSLLWLAIFIFCALVVFRNNREHLNEMRKRLDYKQTYQEMKLSKLNEEKGKLVELRKKDKNDFTIHLKLEEIEKVLLGGDAREQCINYLIAKKHVSRNKVELFLETKKLPALGDMSAEEAAKVSVEENDENHHQAWLTILGVFKRIYS